MTPIRFEITGRGSAQDVMEIIESLKDEIESNGGKVLDNGFFIPEPSRPEIYRSKKGKIKKTKGVKSNVAPSVVSTIEDYLTSKQPF